MNKKLPWIVKIALEYNIKNIKKTIRFLDREIEDIRYFSGYNEKDERCIDEIKNFLSWSKICYERRLHIYQKLLKGTSNKHNKRK